MGGVARDDRMLANIVAMLIALAALAERAAGRSFPVRWLVLAILLPAEAVARKFVVEAIRADGQEFDDFPEFRGSAVDAAGLAMRFRLLAAVLAALLPLPFRFDRWHRCPDRPSRAAAPRPRRLCAPPAARAAGPLDTS